MERNEAHQTSREREQSVEADELTRRALSARAVREMCPKCGWESEIRPPENSFAEERIEPVVTDDEEPVGTPVTWPGDDLRIDPARREAIRQEIVSLKSTQREHTRRRTSNAQIARVLGYAARVGITPAEAATKIARREVTFDEPITISFAG